MPDSVDLDASSSSFTHHPFSIQSFSSNHRVHHSPTNVIRTNSSRHNQKSHSNIINKLNNSSSQPDNTDDPPNLADLSISRTDILRQQDQNTVRNWLGRFRNCTKQIPVLEFPLSSPVCCPFCNEQFRKMDYRRDLGQHLLRAHRNPNEIHFRTRCGINAGASTASIKSHPAKCEICIKWMEEPSKSKRRDSVRPSAASSPVPRIINSSNPTSEISTSLYKTANQPVFPNTIQEPDPKAEPDPDPKAEQDCPSQHNSLVFPFLLDDFDLRDLALPNQLVLRSAKQERNMA